MILNWDAQQMSQNNKLMTLVTVVMLMIRWWNEVNMFQCFVLPVWKCSSFAGGMFVLLEVVRSFKFEFKRFLVICCELITHLLLFIIWIELNWMLIKMLNWHAIIKTRYYPQMNKTCKWECHLRISSFVPTHSGLFILLFMLPLFWQDIFIFMSSLLYLPRRHAVMKATSQLRWSSSKTIPSSPLDFPRWVRGSMACGMRLTFLFSCSKCCFTFMSALFELGAKSVLFDLEVNLLGLSVILLNRFTK